MGLVIALMLSLLGLRTLAAIYRRELREGTGTWLTAILGRTGYECFAGIVCLLFLGYQAFRLLRWVWRSYFIVVVEEKSDVDPLNEE